MPETYPYMISNNKIGGIIDKIKSAAKPSKFSHEFLKNLGYASSNDRAIIPLMKRLGFITEDGSPTSYYDELRDSTKSQYILADRIRDLYHELFQINVEINKESDDIIKGAISRVTGKDETTVLRFFNTFKALVSIAKFTGQRPIVQQQEPIKEEPQKKKSLEQPISHPKQADFHYNIQIHLPATTEISVYNAIFKSLKENLLCD